MVSLEVVEMTGHTSISEDRALRALAAWQELDHGGRAQGVLHVQCVHGHHLAVVYETAEGLVVRAPLRGHAHGSRDRVDVEHGAAEPQFVVDFLDAGPGRDDALPAWCDCGPRTLSRAAIAEWVAAHEGRVVVD